jgi:hypothetical protein
MLTRSTDIQQLHQCPGRWALTLFYEQEQAEATFFGLGSALHETIENAILFDFDLDRALKNVHAKVAVWLVESEDNDRRMIESSKRGADTMKADAERMIRNWFKFVHPDSDKRHPIYDDYQWPPLVEVSFNRTPATTTYPVWGSIDALFWSAIPDDNDPLIIDWKSGTQKQKDYHQLDFYRYGYGSPDARAAYHHLDRVRKPAMIQEAPAYPGDQKVEARIHHAEGRKSELVAGMMPEFNPDWYCNYCPVQGFCPADGDIRNRDKNLTLLERMLSLGRPLTELYEGGDSGTTE